MTSSLSSDERKSSMVISHGPSGSPSPTWSKAGKWAVLEAASSSTRSRGWAPGGPASHPESALRPEPPSAA
eukprot:scaffold71507_cov42-Phaeocystis_antarctica.AAC.2